MLATLLDKLGLFCQKPWAWPPTASWTMGLTRSQTTTLSPSTHSSLSLLMLTLKLELLKWFSKMCQQREAMVLVLSEVEIMSCLAKLKVWLSWTKQLLSQLRLSKNKNMDSLLTKRWVVTCHSTVDLSLSTSAMEKWPASNPPTRSTIILWSTAYKKILASITNKTGLFLEILWKDWFSSTMVLVLLKLNSSTLLP
jgi:hypothetical protein